VREEGRLDVVNFLYLSIILPGFIIPLRIPRTRKMISV